MASSIQRKDKMSNAHVFNQKVVEEGSGDNFFKLLLRDFENHFFSHLHDIDLELIKKEEVILHFYEFFNHLCKTYDGQDMSRSYYFFYVGLADLERHYEDFYRRIDTGLDYDVLFQYAH